MNKSSNKVNLRLNGIKTGQRGYNKELNSDSGRQEEEEKSLHFLCKRPRSTTL